MHSGKTHDVQYSPIILSQKLSSALASGSERSMPDETRLKNTFGEPFYVDEIRFEGIGGAVSDYRNQLGSLQVDLKLGRTPLTHNFVPVAGLGRLLNGLRVVVTNGSYTDFVHTWRFPKPLLVPAGEYLDPVFRLENRLFRPYATAPTGSLEAVRVSYVGRSLPKNFRLPSRSAVPWASVWNAPAIRITAANTDINYLEESTELHLYNPFNEPLLVHRFIGNLVGTSDSLLTTTYDAMSSAFGMTIIGARNLTVQMFDYKGSMATRDRVPFYSAFTPVDRTWTTGAILPPKAFFKAVLHIDKLDGSTLGLSSSQTIVPQITMIGYRMVDMMRAP